MSLKQKSACGDTILPLYSAILYVEQYFALFGYMYPYLDECTFIWSYLPWIPLIL